MAQPADYQAILAPLNNIPGIVRRPLNEKQLSDLEAKLGVAAPAGVRAWLTKVGLFQDVTSHDNVEFEVLSREQDLLSERQAILSLLGREGANLFPFGDDGAGDVIAVRTAPAGDEMMFVDHETQQVSRIGSFDSWLKEVVAGAVAAVQAQPSARGKNWCVQYSFQVASIEPILQILRSVGSVEMIDRDWGEHETSPAMVRSSKLRFRLNGRPLNFSRLEFAGWRTPMFSFNLQEPATTPREQSVVARLDELFQSQKGLGYKLVDYGPLEQDGTDEL